ncbi:RHS repeat domain-containing protein [Cytophaga hutchinsonii]|nr:RHS repeat-associated core domain-containing protein [Cytophaga hutchinsonii]SFX85766.1 RHS repeat-associated core domain-containing protein [Cytophaga hutchinsonii ATCC 33406]
MRTNFFISYLFFFLLSISSNAFETKYMVAMDKAAFGAVDNAIPKLKITDQFAGITPVTYTYKVNLKYTRSQLTDRINATAWNYGLTMVVKIKDGSGNVVGTSSAFTLNLNFKDASDAAGSIYEDVFWISNDFSYVSNPTAELYITAFPSGNTATVPSDIALELTQIQTVTDIFNPAAVVAFNKTSDNKTIYWEYSTGAQFYDLEWVYIDDYDAVTTFAQDADAFIAKEPVRISTALQTFNFHNTYSKGKIYFRVRGVKIDAVTNLVTNGVWNYNAATKIINTDDFEGYKNWQATTTFIENGRYKKSIVYADGSTRTRQSQTSMNSDKTVVISETKYDFEGRPVVNIMPFPYAASTSMNYVANTNVFNVALPTDHQKKAYDNPNKSLALSTASGASQYYSALNPFPAGATRTYTPDAQGYPYSQIIYTPDNTGRVSRQNTVGSAFKMELQANANIKDQHFVQNYYGTPSSTELYRMFGSNVGNAHHYTKNYTIDENGVISIQYQNGEGKVIASALNEKPTTNLSPVSDQYNQTALFDGGVSIHRLSDQNDVNTQGRFSISTDKIINLVSGQQYTFKYDLTSVLNSQNGACLTCGYTVEISVIGPDGRSILTDDTPQHDTIPYYSKELLPTATGCSAVTYPTVQLACTFNLLGEYIVSKKLYYNSAAVQTLNAISAASIPVQMVLDNVLYTDKNAFVSAYTDKKLIAANCGFTCNDNCENYKKSFAGKINPATGAMYTAAELATIKANCMTDCGNEVTNLQGSTADMRCKSYKQQMLDQLSPEGYYYTKLNWISGIYASVTYTPVNGVSPSLAVVTNPDSFNNVWASDMLSKHPEYCVYKNLCENTNSTYTTALNNRDQYDIYKFGSFDPVNGVTGWSDAAAKGFLRPINISAPSFTVPGLPAFNLGSIPTAQLDPFFTTGISVTNPLYNLRDTLLLFFKEGGIIDYNGNGSKADVLSAWEFASFYYLQGNIDGITGAMNLPLPALPSDYDVNRWNIFKGIYLTKKDAFIKKTILQSGCSAPNGFKDPTLESTVIRSQPEVINRQNLTDWAALQTIGTRGCSEEVNQKRALNYLSLLETTYLTIYPTISMPDINLLYYLFYKYLGRGCATDNPSGYIRCDQIATDSYLIRAQQILTGYGMSLNTICTSNAYVTCTSTTTGGTTHFYGPDPLYGALVDLINEYIQRHRNEIEIVTGDPDCDEPTASVFDDINSYTSGVYNSSIWNVKQFTKIAIVQHPAGYPYIGKVFVLLKDVNGVEYISFDKTLTLVRNAGVELNNLKALSNLQTIPFTIAPYSTSLSMDVVKMDNSKVKIELGYGYPQTVISCNNYYIYNKFFIVNKSTNVSLTNYYSDLTSVPTTTTVCQIDYTVTPDPDPCDPLATSKDPLWFPFCMQKEKDKCETEQRAIASIEANELWEDQLNTQLQGLLTVHYNKCFSTPFKENFYYETIELKQLYYTLYYYDQAGNLIQTVPPEGVRLLKKEAFNTKGEYLGVLQPTHGLLTKYKYNSQNQITYKITPDESGANHDIPSYTFYNDKGQPVLSQNAKQKVTNTFSCVSYDKLGRVTKVGDIVNTTLLANLLDRTKYDQNVINYWNADLFTAGNAPTDIVATTYDTPAGSDPAYTNRGRVTKISRALDLAKLNASNMDSYITYQYDVHGNVKTLVNALPMSSTAPGAILSFTMDYTYDLLSGSVKQVILDKGLPSQFIHKYTYDADNRLKTVKTSRNGLIWEEDARYQYYLHGPIARTELGEDRVQGIDYYSTLQGWIKGINTTTQQSTYFNGGNTYNNTGARDVGGDGAEGKNKYVAQDEYMMNLGFYKGDYVPVSTVLAQLGNGSGVHADNLWKMFNASATSLQGLYNGNIAFWINDRSMPNWSPLRDNAYVFKYDQLNRLTNAYYTEQYDYNYTTNELVWKNRELTNKYYDFRAKYDLNGNIKSMLRMSFTVMDTLAYNYSYATVGGTNMLEDNRLRYITDLVAPGTETYDIDDQTAGNYTYDNIGNLIGDVSEQIASITWNREGKVTALTRSTGSTKPDFIFKYDVNGRRIYKEVKGKTPAGALDNTKITRVYYAYDGTGNMLATYEGITTTYPIEFRQVDVSIYGSKRLGVYAHATPVTRTALVGGLMRNANFDKSTSQRRPAYTQYQLEDHLGNVRTVIAGLKFALDQNNDGTPDVYSAYVLTENDYYPFGMQIAGGYRRYSTNNYKFGYNGKPMDNEWNGDGAMYDYGFRIYDPRICKFLSVDPLSPSYPELTPYQFASNTPINSIDLDGLERLLSIIDEKSGVTLIAKVDINNPDYVNGSGDQFIGSMKLGYSYSQIVKNTYGSNISFLNKSELYIKIKADGSYKAYANYENSAAERTFVRAEQFFYHNMKGAEVGGIGISGKASWQVNSLGVRGEWYQNKLGEQGLNFELDYSRAGTISYGAKLGDIAKLRYSWTSYVPSLEANAYLFIKKTPYTAGKSIANYWEGSGTIPIAGGTNLKFEGNSTGTYRFGLNWSTGEQRANLKAGYTTKTTYRWTW